MACREGGRKLMLGLRETGDLRAFSHRWQYSSDLAESVDPRMQFHRDVVSKTVTKPVESGPDLRLYYVQDEAGARPIQVDDRSKIPRKAGAAVPYDNAAHTDPGHYWV